MTSDRKILLTGACGAIATAIRPALRARYSEVRLLDMRHLSDPQAGEIGKGVEHIGQRRQGFF